MKNNASVVYAFFLVVGDFLALVAAFVFAYILRVTLDPRPLVAEVTSREYLSAFSALLPFWLIIFALLGLYNKRTYDKRFSEFGKLLVGTFIGMLFVISYSYLFKREVFPARLVTAYGLLLAFCFVLLFRTIARGVRRSLFNYGIGINNVLIVGDTPITNELVQSLSNVKVTGYKVVGVIGASKHPVGIRENRIFKDFATAIHKLKHEALHSIIQTELYANAAKNNEILTFAQENHVAYRFVPGNSELFVGKLDVDLFASVPVIAVHQTALVGWGRIVKRLFDLVVGGILVIIASPFMLFASLLILIFDRGSVIFTQERLSRFDTPIHVYKFRTMKRAYNGLSPEAAFTKMGRPNLIKKYRDGGDYLVNDPRVSWVGRMLRRLDLDELPQLINVVKGDISLVGPRALVPDELRQSVHKNQILSVKSGLTGLAQISGRRDISFEERRKLDLFYVQNWSFWGDIVILAKTVSIVLFHRGAR